MPEATKNPPDSLEARASELVANPVIDLDTLAADAVDNLVSAPLGQAASELVSAPPSDPSPDLADAVQKLIEDAPAPTAPAAPTDGIESLDAHIATIADDMIAGDFADEQGALKGQVAAPPPVVETPKVAEAVLPVITPAPIADPPPPPDIAPAAAMPPQPAAPPPAAKPQPPERRKAIGSAAKVAASQGVKAAATLHPVGLGLLAVVSSPIRNRSRSFRDMIGWIAVCTLFNGACLWMYVLFFRSPEPPAPRATAAAHVSGHGEDSHGKADAHGKADSHGKKADAHGKADSHGKTDKKKPKKTAAKKPAKKDSKAQASHGGGH